MNLQISSSSGNLFNQVGGLGDTGFSGGVLFKVKVFEYAPSADGSTLARRQLTGNLQHDLNGLSSWLGGVIARNLEGVQFGFRTANREHSRYIDFSSDPSANGLADIRAVTLRAVSRSKTPDNHLSGVFDNPLTSLVEADGYLREELRFITTLNSRVGKDILVAAVPDAGPPLNNLNGPQLGK
jgi:hypothetical protein